MKGLKEHVSGIAWSPDDDVLAIASYDGRLSLWRLNDGENFIELSSRNPFVPSINWCKTRPAITCGDYLGDIFQWSTETWECIGNVKIGSTYFFQIETAFDGLVIASSEQNGEVSIVDLIQKKIVASKQYYNKGSGSANCNATLSWSPDSKYLAIGVEDLLHVMDFAEDGMLHDIYELNLGKLDKGTRIENKKVVDVVNLNSAIKMKNVP